MLEKGCVIDDDCHLIDNEPDSSSYKPPGNVFNSHLESSISKFKVLSLSEYGDIVIYLD